MGSTNKRLWIVVGITLLNSVGFSVVLPLLPFLIGTYLPPHQVSIGMGALMSVFAVCSFFSAPVFGALSDKFGRKNLLLISLAGSAIGYVMFGIGGALWVLFTGRIIDGLTAGNITTLFAYIADTTEPHERSRWYGYIGAVMGMGKIGGPALGGLLGSISTGLPFFVTAALIFMSAIAVYFLLPESLPETSRTKQIVLGSFNIFSHFKDLLRMENLKKLVLTGILFYAGLSIFQFNFTLLLKDIYHWSPAFIGGILTIVGICEILSRALLLPWLLNMVSDQQTGLAGLFILCVGLVLVMVSIFYHSAVLVSIAVVFIISGEGLFDPTYNSLLSQSVEAHKQGKLQGMSQSLQSANNVVVPLIAAFLNYQSAVVLYALAVILMIAAIVLFWLKNLPKTNKKE